jgi:hypothetical protein
MAGMDERGIGIGAHLQGAASGTEYCGDDRSQDQFFQHFHHPI